MEDSSQPEMVSMKTIDKELIIKEVDYLGGYDKVEEKGKWYSVVTRLGINDSPTELSEYYKTIIMNPVVQSPSEDKSSDESTLLNTQDVEIPFKPEQEKNTNETAQDKQEKPSENAENSAKSKTSESEDEKLKKRLADKEEQVEDDDDEEEDEVIFEVEEILGKKWFSRENRFKYYIKWKDYGSDSNTWEPKEHLTDCKELLEKFEQDYKNEELSREKKRKSNSESKPRSKSAVEKKQRIADNIQRVENEIKNKKPLRTLPKNPNTDENATIDEIFGAVMIDDELYLVCSWGGLSSNGMGPVLAKELNMFVPQKVIQFYESRVRFGPEVENIPPKLKKDDAENAEIQKID